MRILETEFRSGFLGRLRYLDRPIVRYLGVGGAAAAVDIGIFIGFASLLDYPYLWVAAAGFLVGTGVNYVLGVLWVFRSPRQSGWLAVCLVYLVSGLGLALHQAVLLFLVEAAQMEMILAKFSATGCVFLWNYGSRKYFIYRHST